MSRSFDDCFRLLTGNSPFPWQRQLYQRFLKGDFPACQLPTGMGKTSVIPIWLLALLEAPTVVPRRLVYVVNRRTVVDQATDDAQKISKALVEDDMLAARCRSLFKHNWDEPLAISTLRGQFADNRAWSADPSRPAIVVGTVDMIGSRLLFQGYRLGWKVRALHAGFLGQDVLLIHDEAHLEHPFQELLNTIVKEQNRCGDLCPLHVMELSATPRNRGNIFKLEAEDRRHPTVKERLAARKGMALHEVPTNKVTETIAQMALSHKDSGQAILIFVNGVEDVLKIRMILVKAKCTCELLTGTKRGKERDELPKTPVFIRFLKESDRLVEVSPAEGTVYLICTSAGEVGVNISGSHLVCDLRTLDNMTQRFGRVNRFGEGDAHIDVIHPGQWKGTDKNDERIEQTLTVLSSLPTRSDGRHDVSPDALDQISQEDREKAFSVPPVVVDATDFLFDAWSLTTIAHQLPGRPDVEPYLHGKAEWEPPQTEVAWREDVDIFTAVKSQWTDTPEILLEDFPLKPHELLRDRSDRVFKAITMIAERHSEHPAWLVDDDGKVKELSLRELADKSKQDQIQGKTIILSPKVGGLSEGMLDGSSLVANDVASDWYTDDSMQIRIRIWDDNPQLQELSRGMRLVRTIIQEGNVDAENLDEETPERRWLWFERPQFGDSDGSKSANMPVLLEDHTRDVMRYLNEFTPLLRLAPDLMKGLDVSAFHHDKGKGRLLWQRSIGNNNASSTSRLLAKSGGAMRSISVGTKYRHEFGSLIDIENDSVFQTLDSHMKDLVLHLIAAHHGRGRPHFPEDEIYDSEPKGRDVSSIAFEAARRFARLQRIYGRWGLAYLESILRAADWAASAEPETTISDKEFLI